MPTHESKTWPDPFQAVTHELKTWPEPFQAVWDRRKLYEVRPDDRNFCVGDRLVLCEWDPVTQQYTGRRILVDVTYKTSSGQWGIPAGLCVLGIYILSQTENNKE